MPFNDDETTQRLTRIFRRVFKQPELVIEPEMTATDVKDWDSLSHINLITAVEKEFKLRFTTGEIIALKNIGDLDSLLRKKMQS